MSVALDRQGPPETTRSNPTLYRQRAIAISRGGLRFLGSAATLGRLTVYVFFAGLVVQALLLTRVWLQLMGNTEQGGIVGHAYDASGVLTSPFTSFEPSTPIKDSGILEFSSLVAIEAYLVVTMLALTILMTLRLAVLGGTTLFRHTRKSREARMERRVVIDTPQT